MRRAARQRAERGKPQWKRAFGYVPDTRPKEEDDGTRKVDRQAQRRVEAAYRAVVQGGDAGTSPRSRRSGTRPGVRGLNGKPWSPSTLSLFLRSPRNAGLRDHNGEIVLDADGKPVKGTWPPLVTRTCGAPRRRCSTAAHTGPQVGPQAPADRGDCGRQGRSGGGHLAGQWVTQAGNPEAERAYALAYTCKVCRGVPIRAEHVEPLLMGLLVERLSRPDAVTLLRAKTWTTRARPRSCANEEAVLLAAPGRRSPTTRRRTCSPASRPSAPPRGSGQAGRHHRAPAGPGPQARLSTAYRWAPTRWPTRSGSCHRTGCARCSTCSRRSRCAGRQGRAHLRPAQGGRGLEGLTGISAYLAIHPHCTRGRPARSARAGTPHPATSAGPR